MILIVGLIIVFISICDSTLNAIEFGQTSAMTFSFVPTNWGKMIFISNAVFEDSQSKLTSSYTKCKLTCFVDPKCQVVSMRTSDEGETECRISKLPLVGVTLQAVSDAMTIARDDDMIIELEKDGYMYDYVKSEWTKYYDALQICKDTHVGGRLPVVKNLYEFGILQTFMKTNAITYTMLGLLWDSNLNDAVWDDGIAYTNTDLSKTIEVKNGDGSNSTFFIDHISALIVEYSVEAAGSFICQINKKLSY